MSQDIYLNTGELSEQQQQMLESEIQDIFDWITQHDETFTQRYTITGWEDKIRRDAEYRKDLYDWIYAKQKEIQEATGEDDRIVGTFDNFERRLFPHDKVQKKKIRFGFHFSRRHYGIRVGDFFMGLIKRAK